MIIMGKILYLTSIRVVTEVVACFEVTYLNY
jgi:hypothetical protein